MIMDEVSVTIMSRKRYEVHLKTYFRNGSLSYFFFRMRQFRRINEVQWTSEDESNYLQSHSSE